MTPPTAGARPRYGVRAPQPSPVQEATLSRTLRAIALGAALALALPGAAFAGEIDTASTVLSATVNPSISIAGVPAVLDLGAAVGGQQVSSGIEVLISSSDPWTLTVSATPFVSGAHTIPAIGNLRFLSTAGEATYAGGNLTLGSQPAEQIGIYLTFPAAARAGTYHSTLTFTATN